MHRKITTKLYNSTKFPVFFPVSQLNRVYCLHAKIKKLHFTPPKIICLLAFPAIYFLGGVCEENLAQTQMSLHYLNSLTIFASTKSIICPNHTHCPTHCPTHQKQIKIHIIIQKQSTNHCPNCPTMHIQSFIPTATTVPPKKYNSCYELFLVVFKL